MEYKRLLFLNNEYEYFFFKGSLVYCIKRDLYEDFVDKYVIFVRINNFKKLMYELFDGRFFKYVKI